MGEGGEGKGKEVKGEKGEVMGEGEWKEGGGKEEERENVHGKGVKVGRIGTNGKQEVGNGARHGARNGARHGNDVNQKFGRRS